LKALAPRLFHRIDSLVFCVPIPITAMESIVSASLFLIFFFFSLSLIRSKQITVFPSEHSHANQRGARERLFNYGKRPLVTKGIWLAREVRQDRGGGRARLHVLYHTTNGRGTATATRRKAKEKDFTEVAPANSIFLPVLCLWLILSSLLVFLPIYL
jgi:hypothetical protein